MNFGNNLKDLRETWNITQGQLAEYLQVSRPTIAGYETKSRQPDFEKLEKIVNVNTQRSPNLSKNAFLHFAQMHPLVFVCFDTLLSLCSKKSH